MRKLFLTFDDGPDLFSTPEILAVLNRWGIKATFFMIGSVVERAGHIDIVKKAFAAGHMIGCHSYAHKHMVGMSMSEIATDLTLADQLLKPYMTHKVFRPPYDAVSPAVNEVSKSLGYSTVLYNVDTRDWDKAGWPDKWIEPTLQTIASKKSDMIVLMHDIHETTAISLNKFLHGLRDVEIAFPKHLASTAARLHENGEIKLSKTSGCKHV